jgi:hypothetical protein
MELRARLYGGSGAQGNLTKKGTGHHLGPNLVILRGHGFNSPAVPPLGSLLCVPPALRLLPASRASSLSLSLSLSASVLSARGIPTRSTGRTRSSTSAYGFTASPPAALIAKN